MAAFALGKDCGNRLANDSVELFIGSKLAHVAVRMKNLQSGAAAAGRPAQGLSQSLRRVCREALKKRGGMGRNFKIMRAANITAPDQSQPVFYEIWTVNFVDGEEKLCRKPDISFSTEKEAQDWVKAQESQER